MSVLRFVPLLSSSTVRACAGRAADRQNLVPASPRPATPCRNPAEGGLFNTGFEPNGYRSLAMPHHPVRNAHSRLALALVSLLAAGAVQADTFTYSGRLDELGAPADGRYDLKLSVHANTGQGYALVKPFEFEGVDVIEGDFRVEFDLPPGYDDA